MSAGKYDMLAEQGATFSLWMAWTDVNDGGIDLTAFTARMQIRTAPSQSAPVLISLTTENGRIELGGTSGSISLLISAADMAGLPADELFYDLEMVEGIQVTRLLEGKFYVSPEVTR